MFPANSLHKAGKIILFVRIINKKVLTLSSRDLCSYEIGNPSDAVQFENDGKKYHPRASFRLWQQTVEKTALSWSKEGLKTAERIRMLSERSVNALVLGFKTG